MPAGQMERKVMQRREWKMKGETAATSAGQDHDRQQRIEAALYYLMSRFAVHPCAWLAQAIVHHLEMRLELHGNLPRPLKRSVYESFIRVWREIARDQARKEREGQSPRPMPLHWATPERTDH